LLFLDDPLVERLAGIRCLTLPCFTTFFEVRHAFLQSPDFGGAVESLLFPVLLGVLQANNLSAIGRHWHLRRGCHFSTPSSQGDKRPTPGVPWGQESAGAQPAACSGLAFESNLRKLVPLVVEAVKADFPRRFDAQRELQDLLDECR
jgi:hypothetical protein